MLKFKFLALIIAIFFVPYLLAQEQSAEEKRAEVFDTDMQQLERSNEQQIPRQPILEQAFDKAIDSSQYVLGPGDQLLVKSWGVMEERFVTEVTPEGYVIVPTVAEVFVSGKTLAKAAALIKAEMERVFKNTSFSVRLLKIRKFRTYVVGEISNPGTYFLRSIDRVTDAIQLAGGISSWGDDTRLEVRHNPGGVDTINISEFYLTGNLEDNPLLSGGDIIYVPPIDLKEDYAIIEGNVGSQGIYQTLPNETLFDFLRRLNAINRQSNIENVLLFRKGEKRVYNLLESESAARDEVIETGDRIIIPTNRNRVYVKGEVAQPGPQPYLANYVAQDYAGIAGILETAKNLEDIYVIRAKTGEIDKGRYVVVDNGDIVVVPRRTREVVKDILTILTPIVSLGLSVIAITR